MVTMYSCTSTLPALCDISRATCDVMSFMLCRVRVSTELLDMVIVPNACFSETP